MKMIMSPWQYDKQEMRRILMLAIPCIISNITVPLLGLVDVSIVGHMGDASYIGAIAVGSMMFNIVYWLFGFLRMGTSGLTAQAVGAGDKAETVRLLKRSVTVGLAIALGMVVMQLPLRSLLMWLLNTPQESAEMVGRYYAILIWGAPAMMCQYGLTGWFIGMQNTRIPMVVSITQNVVNIIASVLMVFGLGMQIEGVALGTLIAQWTGFLMAFFYAWNLGNKRQLPWHVPFLSVSAMLRFFAVNRDLFQRTVCLVAVNLYFTSAGARLGVVILAVNTLLMTLFTLFSHFLDGFAFAAEACVGNAYGAGDKEQLNLTVKSLYWWGAIIVAVFTLVYAVGGEGFLGLLTNEKDVVGAAASYLPWAVLVPAAGVLPFIYDGIFIGITATRGMLISSVFAMVTFFTLCYLMIPTVGNHGLWLALISYLLVRGFVQMWLFYKGEKSML